MPRRFCFIRKLVAIVVVLLIMIVMVVSGRMYVDISPVNNEHRGRALAWRLQVLSMTSSTSYLRSSSPIFGESGPVYAMALALKGKRGVKALESELGSATEVVDRQPYLIGIGYHDSDKIREWLEEHEHDRNAWWAGLLAAEWLGLEDLKPYVKTYYSNHFNEIRGSQLEKSINMFLLMSSE